MEFNTQKYADYYRKHLFHDIMPFWDKNCIDTQYGGYQINLDRRGNPTDSDKYIWFQARQTYVYGLLYNQIEPKKEWLGNALWGLQYLKDKAYVGNGRFNYHMTREGQVKVGAISVFTDCYAVQAISECYLANGHVDVGMIDFLNECYDALEKNIMDPYFKDIYENTWSKKYIWHDLFLTALSAADTATDSLGEKRTKKLVDYCLDKIFNWFVRDEVQLVFEAVGWNKEIVMDDVHGSFINPGHTLESMWFCMNIARKRGDHQMLQKSIEVAKWMLDISIDKEYGGVFSYLNAKGGIPEAIDWFKETNSLWDDKVWWVQIESLCCFAMAYILSEGDPDFVEPFENLHEFCKEYFFDDTYGEWYERLHRDGSVKNSHKGTMWKSGYHLVRGLVFIIKYFNQDY